jgi:hypothetical protein
MDRKNYFPLKPLCQMNQNLFHFKTNFIFVTYFLLCFVPFRAVSEETIFKKSTNQKQELPVAAMFANGSEINEQSL